MSNPKNAARYVRRTVRLTCENEHQWTAERIAEIVGSIKLLGDQVPVLKHVSMMPKTCPRCDGDAAHYEALTEYSPS